MLRGQAVVWQLVQKEYPSADVVTMTLAGVDLLNSITAGHGDTGGLSQPARCIYLGMRLGPDRSEKV